MPHVALGVVLLSAERLRNEGDVFQKRLISLNWKADGGETPYTTAPPLMMGIVALSR